MADNYQIDVTLEEIFGTGIRSVEQTVVSHDPGGVNIWTVTLTNGVQTQMEVRNGDSGGAPVPAYSASEMTDTSAIYLYVGNEEGYNNAHWYVFKDDAWTDFGTYGYPQEAQDRIDEIEADLNESIDDIAESMDSFQSDMENRYDLFVAEHSGQNGETVLFDAGASPVFSGALTLSDDPANYDYIKVTWKHRYNVCVQEFPVSSIGNGCYLNDSLANVSGSSGMFEICQLVLTQDTPGTSARIASARLYDSTGSATGDVTANDNTGIYQIIGVKPMADPEVTDIRLGADGTVYPSAGAAVRGQITDLKSAISGGGMSAEFKAALETLLENVVFKGDDPTGRSYLNDLHDAMYPPATLTSISAVYTQSGEVYTTDSLDDLKADLVVTAHYDNGTSEIVTTYTLSGTLTEGTSTITVSYEGKTTTFTVTVSPYSPWRNNVLTLTSDDLVRARVDNASPYYVSSTTRVSYVGMDIDVSTDYTYTFNYTTTVTGTTTNIGIQYLTQGGVDLVNQQGTFNNSDNRKVDLGWQSDGYVLTPAETAKVVWLGFRAGTGTTTIQTANFPTITVTRTAVS